MPQSEIEELDVIFLLFSEGMLPLRASGVNRVVYDYNLSEEITGFTPLSPGEFRNIGVLASTLLNSTDILRFPEPDQLLHVEFGLSPTTIKLFQYYPKGKKLRTFGNNVWSNTDTQFGGISGRTSPFFEPSADSGLMILPETEPSFEILNNDTIPVSPIIRLKMEFFTYEYLTDPTYVFDMLNGIYPRKPLKFTMGPAENLIELAKNIGNMRKGAYLLVPYSTSSASEIQSKVNTGSGGG